MNILKSQRLHIGLFGKRNVGKSSLLNLLSGQNSSIVSDIAGTTTDFVEKAMELLPIGPVVIFDTAGIDDTGELGKQRVKKTYNLLNRIDIALIICDFNGIDDYELNLINKFKELNTPFGIIINKNDIEEISQENLGKIQNITDKFISVNSNEKSYINEIKDHIIKIMPDGFFDDEKILDDIIQPNDTVINVIPIDSSAPKGRLILPQVRTIRNILDNNAITIAVKPTELQNAINNLKTPPKLVITDSQAFKEVSSIVPQNIKLTSYSILFARLKGDLNTFIKGANQISKLSDGDKILVCESCTHHSTCEDIGRVKIPNLIKKTINKNLIFETYSGHDFPDNISEYSLIIHCGACMTNKKEVLSRILKANNANIPITNYGIAIAYCLGILDRATEIF